MFTVGIWLPIDFRGHWKGEGIARIVKYALEGSTRLPASEQLKFRLYTNAWVMPEVVEDLKGLAPFIESGQIEIVPFAQGKWTLRAVAMLKKPWPVAPRGKVKPGQTLQHSSLFAEATQRIRRKLMRYLKKPSNVIRAQSIRVAAMLVSYHQRRDLLVNAQQLGRDAVDVWWVPYIGADGVEFLQSPIVAHFFDFMLLEYPAGWPADDVGIQFLFQRFVSGLGRAERVIATSQHAKRDQLLPHFPVAPDKVEVIYNPMPDYYRHLLPTVAAGAQWPAIRQEASRMVRAYIQQRMASDTWVQKDNYTQNYLLPYYASIDWANTTYLFAPTQDRPYKNLHRLVQLVEDLVRKEGMDVKLVLSAALDMTSKSALSRYVYDNNLTRHIISLPRVPDEIHAALYAGAAMSVHASYIEGGIGTSSYIEGLYVGCPALVAEGPHTREAAELLGNGFEETMFLADRPDQLKALVLHTLQNREAVLARQQKQHANLDRYDATSTVQNYFSVFRAAAARAASQANE